MEFKQSLVSSFSEILSMFGMSPVLETETESNRLESGSQVNILIGFTSGISGSVVIGIEKATAYKIVSTMMCGAEVTAIDPMVKSALGELANMVLGTAIQKMESPAFIDISPPTLFIGNELFLRISKTKSYKLGFKAGEDIVNISYSLE